MTPREIFVVVASLPAVDLFCKPPAKSEFVENAGFKGESSEVVRESAQ